MIWFRRSAAVFLSIFVVVLFIAALVVTRVNDTAGNPQFYVDELRKADVYNFVYDDALPAALNESGDMPDMVTVFQPQIVSIAKQTLPPEWLQAQVEQVINKVLPYFLGDVDSFNVNIPVKERVLAGVAAAKTTLHGPDVFPRVYDDAIKQIVDKAAENMSGAPAAFALSRSELDTLLRSVVTREWLLAQMDNALDQLVPYLTKDKDTFTIRVNILDRMDALEAAVTTLLKRPQTYDYVYQDLLVPAIRKNIGASVPLPVPGLALTDAEILQTVKQALPLDWYQAQVTDIVKQTFSYLKGQRQTLSIALPLTDRKAAITQSMVTLVEQKLRGLGITPDMVRQLLGSDIATILRPQVDKWVPDQLAFTDAELRSALGSLGGSGDVLVQAKDWVQKGFTFTDQDLRTSLGINNTSLQDFRNTVAGGVTFTEVDLRKQIGSQQGGQGNQDLQNLDDARSALKTARGLRLLLWIVPLLMLVGIGFLGGRRWSTRLIWGAAPLAVSGFIALIVFGPIFGSTAMTAVDQALAKANQGMTGVELLMTQKATEIAQSAVDNFIGGLRVQAFIMLIIGLGAAAGGAVWYWSEKKREGQKVQ